VQANNNDVRPDIKIQGETPMTRFVLVVILAVTSTFVGSDVATAASNPAQADSQASLTSTIAPEVDISEFGQTTSENSSHVNSTPVLRLNELAQVFVRTSWACYTPVGACTMVAPAPVGSSCYCVFPGGTFWGTVQ
jgi:hypothetical protein